MASSPIFITCDTLQSSLSYPSLINHLEASLPSITSTIQSPPRQVHPISPSSSLLLMPSWSSSPSLPYIGVKLVTYFPLNSALNLPGVQANYTLFRSSNGQHIASIDGTLLTLYRTSCVSALASKLLSKEDSEVMLMVGAGSLAPHLIRAHISARPSIKKVMIWNRTASKAEEMVEEFRVSDLGVDFESCAELEGAVSIADIVSCATNSEAPLVKGRMMKAGAHLDLVGSFKETMMECDDEAVRRGIVVVDDAAAMEEAGEIVGAIGRRVIEKDEVLLLKEVIGGNRISRGDKDITVFKSVGSAAVDLLAAQLVYENYTKN